MKALEGEGPSRCLFCDCTTSPINRLLDKINCIPRFYGGQTFPSPHQLWPPTAGLGWAPCRVCHNTDTSKTPTTTSRPLVFPFFNWIQKISNRVIFLLQLEARVWKIGAGEDGNATALCHGEMNARPGRALFGCNLQCYSDENCALLSRIILHSFVRDNCSYAKVSQIFHHKNEDCISLIWE